MNTAADTSTLKNWDRVRLGDHTQKIGSGLTPRGHEAAYLKSGIPLIRSQNVHMNRFELEGLVRISQEQDSEMDDTRVYPEDVLLNITGASIGRVCLAPSQLCPANVNQHVCIIRTDPTIDPAFLSYFLASPDFQRFIVNTEAGATRQALTKGQIEDFQVPRPTLPEQRRITRLLEQADRLRRTCLYALEVADNFLPTAFREFFGDPVTNSMGWEVCALEDLGDLDRGRSKHRPRNAPELLGGPYPLIQTGDVANSRGYIRTYKQTYSELGLKQSKMWPKGTLCITIAANIAKTGILLFDACFPDSVVGFTPNTKTNTEYVQLWFSFVQQHLERTAPESAQKNINLEILRGLRIPLPPL